MIVVSYEQVKVIQCRYSAIPAGTIRSTDPVRTRRTAVVRRTAEYTTTISSVAVWTCNNNYHINKAPYILYGDRLNLANLLIKMTNPSNLNLAWVGCSHTLPLNPYFKRGARARAPLTMYAWRAGGRRRRRPQTPPASLSPSTVSRLDSSACSR